ncbi:MAG: hypothetical protein EOS23_26735 [Mesorhizobium sp.]|nr:MAG: hypothetical protein EOS23_26735 [Mesorhizobium sp.]
MTLRAVSRFPTRHYPYHAPRDESALDASPDPLTHIQAGSIVRFFLGQDELPVELSSESLRQEVNDPFAHLVLGAGHRPQTLLDVLAILDAVSGSAAIPGQRLYRLAEGGQIPWSAETAGLDRRLRLVITRHRGEDAELVISTAPPFSSATIFLQLFAWDPKLGAYNFYERRRGVWSWAGSSWQALDPPTRGHGPFDSHVNGAPVMKELKLPWMHWHSQSASIPDDILAADDPLRQDPFYHGTHLKGGEDLELTVRAGIARWTRSHFDRRVSNGRLSRAPEFFRHVLMTTTVNLTSSPQRGSSLGPDDMLRLPTTFFINSDSIIDDLGLPATFNRQKVSASFYASRLREYGVRLQDGTFSLDSDTHFAFAVPEPSLEDRVVLGELLKRGALSRRLAACMLMVDFCNPIFSPRREALLRFIPNEIALNGGKDMDDQFIRSVTGSPGATHQGSPEAELLTFWNLETSNWEVLMAERLERYWANVGAALSTVEGFDGIFRLAESRRRVFRKRPLAEFGLTLAIATRLDLPQRLQMTEEGRVVPNPITEDDADAIV